MRNRKKLKAVNVNRYRVSVSKSLNNLFAQIIDDKQKTLVSASSIEKEIKAKKVKNGKIKFNWWSISKRAKEKILLKFILIEVDINITVE